jgi:ubiquinone/menaquinone biosynthesis C-methylase UbiE
MSLGTRFAQLPRPVAHRLLRLLRYLNLMRALEWRLLERWLKEGSARHVLDVGCGHGLYSLDLVRRGATLVGCDLDHGALSDAQQSSQGLGLAGRAGYLVADGASLPLPEGEFDLVICNCVLEHIADDGAALKSMARVLQPGGMLYLTVDSASPDLALGFLEGLPEALKTRLLRPQVIAADSVMDGLEARLDDLYAVRRRYRQDELVATLADLHLEVLDSQFYLTGAGAAQYEAFHALRGLDPARGLGRLLYMVSSILLYPLAAWSDNRPAKHGHGLAVVARKQEDQRNVINSLRPVKAPPGSFGGDAA